MAVVDECAEPLPNRLLASLPVEELARLGPRLERVLLQPSESLYEALEPIDNVIFVSNGICSLVRTPRDGVIIENTVVGREGMVGISVLLGVDRTPSRGLVQIPGSGLRMSSTDFKTLVRPGTVLYSRLLRYANFVMEQMAQGMACNRLHTLEQRCARWLLMTHDRIDGDHFSLTQEFLAQMLGVRRSSVSPIANQMAQRGLIHYRHGLVSIPDRAGLEAAACECYGHIEAEYERLFRSSAPS